MKQGLLATLILSLGFLSTGARAQTQPKREILDMAELSERRIRQNVQDYLGPQARAVVNVFLREKSTPAKGGTDDGWLLSGPYAPENAETSTELEAEVSIQVESFVSSEKRAEIDRIAKSVLRGLPVKVSVTASLAPPVAQAEKEKDEASRKPSSVGDADKDLLQRWAHRYGPLMPFAGALVLLIGVLFAGSVLRSAAASVSDSLRSMNPSVSNSGSQTISLNESLSARTNPPSSGNALAARPAPPSIGVEVRKNLRCVESYLLESPMLFVRSMSDDPSDLLGLKFMVAKFSPEARSKLKELLGMERILKASSYQAGEDVVGFDATGWIQQLIEKIELKKLAGGTVVEEALSSDESLLLSGVGAEGLFEAVLKVNTPAAWRVATDFLPPEELRRLGKGIDRAMWSNLVKGSLVHDRSEVHAAARQLIDLVRTGSSENVILFKAHRERDEHFTKRLLPSLVDAILSQELGEDDAFVEHILRDSPEFAKILRASLWTPSRLADVNDDSLKTVFLGLDNGQRSTLLYILPDPHAKRLESYLPDSLMKRIVLDGADKLKTTADTETRDRARAMAREFLDYLRVQVANGKVQLKVGEMAAAPRPVTTTDIVDADEITRKAS